MTSLSVNLNKVALLRNARGPELNLPNVAEAAKAVIAAGANGITVHPRPDERHVKYADVYELNKHRSVEFNIEGNPFTGRYIQIVKDVRPDQATLVPDSPDANTSDHGWDVGANKERLAPIIEELKKLGIRVSLFMDADSDEFEMAKHLGADRVELYTEPYARAFREDENLDEVLAQFASAAKKAQALGLGVNAGHDLNLQNLGKFCAAAGGVLEVSIGHALMAEALYDGLENVIKDYLKILAHA